MLHLEHTPSIAELQTSVQGTVLIPDDKQYHAARQAWNLSVDQHPAVILIAQNAADVAAGIRFARAYGLGVAVQSTGHGVVLPADDGLLIITSQLSAVEVDAQTQTARIEAGAVWGTVVAKTQPYGLLPLLGSSSGVGAIGYTLGGGMGWLARKYGLAVDSVVEFEVVTADGQVRSASETENPDLFWALRGGGKGALGVVTAMRIRLYPVTQVYAGSVIYPLDAAKEVFQFYREWIQYLPVEWTTSISIMHFPPLPHLPPFLSGQSVVMITGCYSGEAATGQMMAQALVDWKQPIVNTFHPMPMTESDMISNDPVDPLAARSTGAWLTDLSDDTIDRLLALVSSRSGAFMKTDIRHIGGVVAQVADEQNAYHHRSATLLMQCIGITPTPEAVQRFEESVTALKRALRPSLTGGVYMNFLEGAEAHQETAKAFSTEKYQRLMALKTQYDPDNLFRFGYNIPTAAR
jgi:FAD/FMN-containing dehydrogenase